MNLDKIYIAQINTVAGNVEFNLQNIISYYQIAENEGCELLIFPECAVSGYPADDLWLDQKFYEECEAALKKIIALSASYKCALIIGLPFRDNTKMMNAALMIHQGIEVGRTYKTNLPQYGVFDELRYFAPNKIENVQPIIWKQYKIALAICEDIWYPEVIAQLMNYDPDIIIAINASPYSLDKRNKRIEMMQAFAKQYAVDAIYCNLYGGQDELIFDGSSFAINSDGELSSPIFSWREGICRLSESYDQSYYLAKTQDIYQALIVGIKDYFFKNNTKKAVVGISGGIDSALVATLAADALGVENVKGVMLQSTYTSRESMMYAEQLAKSIGIEYLSLSIESMHFTILELLSKQVKKITNQNIQARIRAVVLMAIANEDNSFLLATGNKSEYAVGYSTIYGDMCGAFAPIKDIYKGTVYELVEWRNYNLPIISLNNIKNPIPKDIILREPTAELDVDQRDEDTLPPYPVLDKILKSLIEDGLQTLDNMDIKLINSIKNMIIKSEFKRKQAPTGPKISSRAFGRDWRFPVSRKLETSSK